jgi:DnaK suppressor protein
MTEDERNHLKRTIEERVNALKSTTDEKGGEGKQNTLARLDQILILLSDPDYGTCTVCGKAIDIDRLVAVPESRVCAACAD